MTRRLRANPAQIAKLLSDALNQVDDLKRQLYDADRRAAKAERLLAQLQSSPSPSTLTNPLQLLSGTFLSRSASLLGLQARVNSAESSSLFSGSAHYPHLSHRYWL